MMPPRMSPRMNHLLYRSRARWPLVAGVVLTLFEISYDAWPVVAVVGAVTIIATLATYLLVDRRVMKALPDNREQQVTPGNQ